MMHSQSSRLRQNSLQFLRGWRSCGSAFVSMSIAILVTWCSAGCQQAGAPNGFAGSAPINQLPGQTAMTGPTLPSLGPFGASARVPPPATGSYGNAATNMNFGAGANYNPAGYAPNGVQPMSFDQPTGTAANGRIANAGGDGWVETSAQDAGSGSQPSFGNQQGNGFNQGNAANRSNDIRAGGMQVSDLTGGPPPPGYSAPIGYSPAQGYSAAQGGNPNQYGRQSQAGAAPNVQSYGGQINYAANAAQAQNYQAPPLIRAPGFSDGSGFQPMDSQNPQFNDPGQLNQPAGGFQSTPNPMRSTSQPIAPVFEDGLVNSPPAANQPAFSTADRPLQWQAPRR